MRLSVVFWVLLAIYTISGIIAKLVFPELLPPPRTFPLLYAVAFAIAMASGYAVARIIPRRVRAVTYVLTVLLVLSATGWWGFPVALAAIAMPAALAREEGRKIKKAPTTVAVTIDVLLVAVALILAMIPVVMGKMPLLHPQVRYTNVRFFYLASGYLVVSALSVRSDFRVFLIGLAIAIISTFRTVGLAVTIAYLLKLVQEGNLKAGAEKWLLKIGTLSAGVMALFLVRYYATLHTYPEWKLGFFETLFYRMGFTYSVYERLFEIGIPWGDLKILISTDPKGYVGRLFGSSVVYNYTIFGQPVHDFGILGLGEGFLLGGILKDTEGTRVTEVLALTLFILMIPIGIDGFFLPTTAFLAYLALGVKTWERTEHWV
ncbi:hypothetical protein [Thermococcus sp. MAR1]|uniref:hypothetical protein n=1 Tax=Thermococcus sp. MAR1 TaxID=1638263 RepID=UPI00143A3072|nr:hypothetical protein [Thermococcus sp. MAR1]NJE09749.1 hypothetical protein [Thermococcus sp. MAR1]